MHNLSDDYLKNAYIQIKISWNLQRLAAQQSLLEQTTLFCKLPSLKKDGPLPPPPVLARKTPIRVKPLVYSLCGA
jgi:hypothetical protein